MFKCQTQKISQCVPVLEPGWLYLVTWCSGYLSLLTLALNMWTGDFIIASQFCRLSAPKVSCRINKDKGGGMKDHPGDWNSSLMMFLVSCDWNRACWKPKVPISRTTAAAITRVEKCSLIADRITCYLISEGPERHTGTLHRAGNIHWTMMGPSGPPQQSITKHMDTRMFLMLRHRQSK